MLLFGEFSIPFLLAVMIALFFGMGWHEYAHAVVADRWGDPTPRSLGRLTPNPIVHIYWPGWIMFVLIGFGILGSVPISPQKMRDPRWGSFWTSFAGPLANLAMAFISALLLRLIADPISALRLFLQPNSVSTPVEFLVLVLIVSIYFNVLLFIFNLLPFFPLDGWHMMLALLPGTWLTYKQIPQFIRTNLAPVAGFLQQPAYKWQQWAQISQYVFLGLILTGLLPGFPSVLGAIISQPTGQIMRVLLGI